MARPSAAILLERRSIVSLSYSDRSSSNVTRKVAWTIPASPDFEKSPDSRPTKIMALDWGETLEELFPCYSCIADRGSSGSREGVGNIGRNDYHQLLSTAVKKESGFTAFYAALQTIYENVPTEFGAIPPREEVQKKYKELEI